jgi:hypothetical protein
MSDYGHDLSFGTFITPANQRPQDVVALAALTEDAGLDLVTFQDHPYQPGFLDTWTLLSWVAAKTERVHLSGNVINLPLRPPAVLARAAASLDLLSGGRFELGLGAGAFWDAIEGMGGPRRTPGQGVSALEEAIEIIRAIWDPAERRGVNVDGEYYKVRGAKRGPAPAHDVSIWLGAVKPRMLDLTGRKADGWLPSLPYFTLAELDRGNEIIDDAARAAERDPREIKRLINIQGTFASGNGGFLQGPPGQWVEELLPFVLERGFSTLILMVDEPRTIEIYAGEVAPALREAVAAERERAGTQTGEVVRSPKALALRREGIDYEALARTLRKTAIEPGDRGYRSARSTYFRGGSPGLVLAPASVEEVSDALAFAREQPVPLSVRSGGHGISGRSTNDGGIVIDVGRLDEIVVLDPESGRIRVGPGARWGEVAQALGPHGLAMSSGDYGDVGVGGLATAGGIGLLVRKYGLTIDHVVAAEIVLADGTMVRASAERNAELFWALRGAGANFGIVTAFELDAYRLGDVVFAEMTFDAADLGSLLERWGAVVEQAPRELTSFLSASARSAHLLSVYAGADTADAVDALNPLLGIGTVIDQRAGLAPYAALIPPAGHDHSASTTPPLISNGFTEHFTPELSGRLASGLRSGDVSLLSIRSVGGAVNDLAPNATAYAHRHQNFNVGGLAYGVSERDFHGYWDELRTQLDGLYPSFETDLRPERLADAFPEPTLSRLRELKARYDPDNTFNQNFAITQVDSQRRDHALV